MAKKASCLHAFPSAKTLCKSHASRGQAQKKIAPCLALVSAGWALQRAEHPWRWLPPPAPLPLCADHATARHHRASHALRTAPCNRASRIQPDHPCMPLQKLGLKKALVVHSSGLDELTPMAPADIVEVAADSSALKRYSLDPKDLGIPRCEVRAIRYLWSLGGGVLYLGGRTAGAMGRVLAALDQGVRGWVKACVLLVSTFAAWPGWMRLWVDLECICEWICECICECIYEWIWSASVCASMDASVSGSGVHLWVCLCVRLWVRLWVHLRALQSD